MNFIHALNPYTYVMKSYVIACMLAILAFSCHKDEMARDKPSGVLKIKVGLYISVGEVRENLKSTSGVEDFRVVIFSADDLEVLAFEKASDLPPEIRLETGTYYVTASSENNLPAAFDNPYYFGRSDTFTITPGGQQSVVVNCELSNAVVAVVYSDQVRDNFSDYSTTVSSSAGSLVFGRTETRQGYFQPLDLSIEAVLTWEKPDGTFESKTLTGSISNPQPKRKYEIHVDAAGGEGMSMIVVNLGDTVIPVEIVNISEEPVNPDGTLNPGDLLITEIMYDPVSLTDTYGEWFEIYNNTGHPVNLLHLVITKSGTDRHIITAPITLASHGYQVFARADTAVAVDKYVYGTSITLNNTGAILALPNYGTDGTNGTEICSVDYGEEGFPSGSGASISLNPEAMNVQEEPLGASWCVSSSVYSTGDLGTPGAINDECNQETR
jgi:hypothetical protein